MGYIPINELLAANQKKVQADLWAANAVYREAQEASALADAARAGQVTAEQTLPVTLAEYQRPSRFLVQDQKETDWTSYGKTVRTRTDEKETTLERSLSRANGGRPRKSGRQETSRKSAAQKEREIGRRNTFLEAGGKLEGWDAKKGAPKKRKAKARKREAGTGTTGDYLTTLSEREQRARLAREY